MLFSEINPFVRYAGRFIYHPTDNPLCAYDKRLFFTMSPKICLELGGNAFTLGRGATVFIPPGTPYRFLSPESFEITVINFDFTQKCCERTTTMRRVEPSSFSQGIEQLELSDCQCFNTPMIMDKVEWVEKNLLDILAEFKNMSLFYREKSSSLLRLILSDMARIQMAGGKKSALAAEKVIAYIQENYGKKITNSELSALANYHEYHLNKLMIANTGFTLHKYIMNYRIIVAQKLLISGNLSISEIAEETGFDSPAHFSGCFLKLTGMTPSEYRRTSPGIV